MSSRSDNFNRADSAFGLGAPSDGGANWTPYGVDVYGISGNRAKAQVGASQRITMLSGGDADGSYRVDLSVIGADGGIAWRGTDDFNHFVQVTAGAATTVYRKQGGSYNSVYSDSTGWSAADNAGVDLSGSSHTLFKNGSSFGSFTDSFQSTATDNAGLRDNSGAGTKMEFDNVTWTPAGGGETVTVDKWFRMLDTPARRCNEMLVYFRRTLWEGLIRFRERTRTRQAQPASG